MEFFFKSELPFLAEPPAGVVNLDNSIRRWYIYQHGRHDAVE
jgi:hypothetical protein